jgi:DNA repair exonuclease SbcCD ATPase subunit
MAELEKQVRRVMRRLNFQQFVEVLIWCWVAALTLALCWTLVEKLWRPFIEPWWLTVVGSLVLGLIAAVAIWLFRRPSSVQAAVALDQAFGLKERVSTTLTLPSDMRDTPAGLALIHDATKRVETLDIGEKFGFRMPRTAWVPVIPAILVFLVASFVNFEKSASAQAKTEVVKERAQVETAVKTLAKRFEAQRDKIKDQGMGDTEAEKLLAELAKKTKDLEDSKEKDLDQKKGLAQFNQLQDALKDRRDKLGSTEQMQKQLEKMKLSTDKGPAEKFQDALKQGDFKKAINELNKIAEKLKSGQLTPEEKKQLEKQLSQMKEQLQKMANVEERKKQLEEQLKKAGVPQEQVQQELAKLDAQAGDMQKMQELAEKIGEMQKALSQDDVEKALQSLEMTKGDLQQMMQALEQMEMLDDLMNEIQDMKNAMVCKNCGGAGCPACNNQNRGRGQGFRRGAEGSRDEEEDSTKSFDSKVSQKIRPKGKMEVTALVSGKQVKGESILIDQDSLQAEAAAATDAINQQNIPREYKKHAKEYFENVGGTK